MPIQRKKGTANPYEPKSPVDRKGGNVKSERRKEVSAKIKQKAAGGKAAENAIKTREKLQSEALEAVVDYAASAIQKAALREADPVKVALGVFRALPSCEKLPDRVFCEHFGISRPTLNEWRFHDDVEKARRLTLQTYLTRFTPGVLERMAEFAKKTNWKTGQGDAAMIKLFLQWAEGFKEKTETDLTSGGQPIVLGLEGSPFVDPSKAPKKK